MYKHNHEWKRKQTSKRQREYELETCSRWSEHLPEEIMELILRRLCLNDYLRFGAVCSSWRSAVAKAIASKHCPPAPQLPLLMFCAYTYTKTDHSFLNLSDGRISLPCRANLSGRNCIGSIEGWLIITDGFMWRPEGFLDFWSPSSSLFGFEKVKNFFFNPVSGARVMLPSQLTIPCSANFNVMFFHRVVASSVPTSPNCIVAALCLGGDLVFCSPSDKTWTLIDKDRRLRIREIAIHKGKLYAVTFNPMDFVMVFDLLSGAPPGKAKMLVMLHPSPVVLSDAARMEGQNVVVSNISSFYLVLDFASSELLLIMRIADYVYREDSFLRPLLADYIVPPKAKGFKVFRLDQSGPRWVQVETLGDRILFVSHKTCKCFSASAMGDSLKEFRGNCIYFAFDYVCMASPSLGRDVGVFSLADGSIKRHLPSVSRSWAAAPPLWFTPNPW